MSTQTTIDEQTFTITFERDFAAPREDVFDAWLDPEMVKLWWDPTGTPLAACTIDARVGGHFSFDHASGHAHSFQGVYKLLDRPARLVFDALGAEGIVRLDTAGTGTHMTVSIRCPSAEHFARLIEIGVHHGTARTLDNLVDFSSRRHAS